MTDIQRLINQLKNNLPLFAEMFLKVVNTKGELVPLKFNTSQLILHKFIEDQLEETGMARVIVPKGRKQGVSTYTEARFFHKTIFNSHKNAFILSHHSGTTKVLFDMVRTFYNNLPGQLKHALIIDNSRELEFENHSKYSIATAGEGEIGRGSTPQYLHCSEMASYENTDAIQTGILKAVALAEGTEVIIESTAKGIGNMFHQYTVAAVEKRSVYRVCFLPWYVHEDNTYPIPKDFTLMAEEAALKERYDLTNSQIYWRRLTKEEFNDDWKFKQEFPATLIEAFQSSGTSFFNPEVIYQSQENQVEQGTKAMVFGVDPARKGDRTVIAIRQGRKMFDPIVYNDMDDMKLAGILATLINKHNPQKVFIDTGTGWGPIDRLNELGFSRIVQGVNFGEKSLQPDVYKNKRAEMYYAFREWMEKNEVELPKSEDMTMDLLAIPDSMNDSSGRLILPSKDKIKKDYKKSPDIADAMVLTFAYPVRENIAGMEQLRYSGNKKKKDSKWSSPVMQSFEKKKRVF